MATNPIGHSTSNLSANIPKALKAAIAERAASCNLTQSTFVRVILEDAIMRDVFVDTTSSARKKDQKALIHDVISITTKDDSGETEARKFDHYRRSWDRNFETGS